MKTAKHIVAALQIATFVSMGLISGCSKNKSESGSQTSSQQPQISSMLSVANNAISSGDLSVQDRASVTIQKSALGKEFFFESHRTPQVIITEGMSLYTRIVKFHRVDNHVFLLESAEGNVVSTHVPATLILARIPIVRETDTALVLDLNAGLNQIFTLPLWYIANASQRPDSYTPDTRFAATPVRLSFINSAQIADNTLVVSQVVQTDEDKTRGLFEVRYFFTPFSENPGFPVKAQIQDFRNFGYFETHPQLESTNGRASPRTAHADIRSPIKWYISANTPEEIRPAIADGIKYWNAVFGREVVTVDVAPEGVSAPHHSMNIVQWVANDLNGGARADIFLNPRTGEIRRAQVYIRSGVLYQDLSDILGIERAARISHTATTAQPATASPTAPNPAPTPAQTEVSPPETQAASVCTYQDGDAPQATLMLAPEKLSLLQQRLPDISLDNVRAVVAHEVGHTLGLRHNFAGTAAANVTPSEILESFNSYLETGEVSQTNVFTSSIMDYVTVSQNAQIGAAIRLKTRNMVLPHDRAAIANLYDLSPNETVTFPYCFDQQGYSYYRPEPLALLDCQQWDSGAHPLVSNTWTMQQAAARAPEGLFYRLMNALYPEDPRDVRAREMTTFTEYTLIDELTSAFRQQLIWFRPNPPRSATTRLLILPALQHLRSEAEPPFYNWANQQIEMVGGVVPALFAYLPSEDRPALSYKTQWSRTIEDLLVNPEMTTFMGMDRQIHTLTSEDIQHIRNVATRIIPSAEEQMLQSMITELSSVTFKDSPHSQTIDEQLIKIARHFVLKLSDEFVTGSTTVHKAYYPQIIRQRAAGLLSDSMTERQGWAAAARETLRTDLQQLIEREVGKPLRDIRDVELSGPVRQWYLQQQNVLRNIY